MGGSPVQKKPVAEIFMDIAAKTGVNLIIPDNINNTCCGQIFSSKGFTPCLSVYRQSNHRKIVELDRAGKMAGCAGHQ